MNWLQLFELLDKECKLWHEDILEDKGKKIPFLGEKEHSELQFKIQKGVDLACQYYSENFSNNRRWPIIEPEMVFGIFERLQEARAFARFISCPEIPRDFPELSKPMLISDTEMLDWILIGYWRQAGAWRWMYRIGKPYEE